MNYSPRPPDFVKRLARHEAAHAVVAFFEGEPIRHVTIEPKPFTNEQGTTQLLPLREARSLTGRLKISMAGALAGDIVTDAAEVARDDEGFVKHMVEALDLKPVQVATLREETRRLLRDNNECVEALADELLRRRYLAGNEVVRIIEKVRTATVITESVELEIVRLVR